MVGDVGFNSGFLLGQFNKIWGSDSACGVKQCSGRFLQGGIPTVRLTVGRRLSATHGLAELHYVCGSVPATITQVPIVPHTDKCQKYARFLAREAHHSLP